MKDILKTVTVATIAILTLIALGWGPSPAQSQSHPECQIADSDPDGDGYGWENNATCIAGKQLAPAPDFPQGSTACSVSADAIVGKMQAGNLDVSGVLSLVREIASLPFLCRSQ